MQPTADSAPPALPGDYVEFLLPGLVLPLPDEAAALAAWERLSSIDIGVNAPTIAGLGMLAEAVAFVAGVQATPFPRPILSTRVVLVTGSHAGGVVAGPVPDPRTAIPLQQLANGVGAGSVTLEWQPASSAIELEDAISPEQMDVALRAGWAEAERAADEGIELLVLAAGGAGASAAAVAVISAISGYEATALLGRVVTPAGLYDDNAWMTRCLALRDALHRVRHRSGDPRTVLSALGGADVAAATGLLLGAASRRLPVMIDGPVGAAAAMLANDFSPQVRKWLLLPDTGRNVAVMVAAEALELRPWLDLCLDLGEGVTSLNALPMLQTALTLAGAGEPVEAGPLTRFDSTTGGQIFVGVARPVEPAEVAEEEPETAPKPTPAKSIGAKAKGGPKPAPPKPTPAKAPQKRSGRPAKNGSKPAAKAASAGAAKSQGPSGTSGGAPTTTGTPAAATTATPAADSATTPAPTQAPETTQTPEPTKTPAPTQTETPAATQTETPAAAQTQTPAATETPASAPTPASMPAKAPAKAAPAKAVPAKATPAPRPADGPPEPESSSVDGGAPSSASGEESVAVATPNGSAASNDSAESDPGAPRPRKRP